MLAPGCGRKECGDCGAVRGLGHVADAEGVLTASTTGHPLHSAVSPALGVFVKVQVVLSLVLLQVFFSVNRGGGILASLY